MGSLYDLLDPTLKQIRLVQLLPSSTVSDDIVFNLLTVSLASNPEYIALSYVWGNPAATSCIAVNGVPFQATTNLVAALRQIRLKDEPVVLWIDAICINQNDKTEKSTQIQLMRDIYQSARAVTVWLGEADIHTERAIKIMSFTAYLSRSGTGSDTILEAMEATMREEDIAALISFLQRDWWSRIWVIQEVAVAPRALFLCGQNAMVFHDFKDAYVCWSGLIKGHQGPLQGPMRRLNDVIQMTSARVILWQHARHHMEESLRDSLLNKQYALEYMLEESWNFDSTNPRDKVYAWLGLLHPGDVSLIPDYNATVSEAYVGLVRAVMEHSGSLSLVSFTGSTGRPTKLDPIPGLPSWAPDLRKDAVPMFTWWLRPKSFRASSSVKANATISSDGKLLVSDVLPVGRLVTIDADQNEHQDLAVGEKLCRWLELAMQNKSARAEDSHDASDAFFKTLTCYHYDDHINFDPGYFQNLLRKTESLRLGFMAYVGYLDRLRDCVEWRNAHPDRQIPYHFEAIVFSGSVTDTSSSILPRRLRNTRMSATRRQRTIPEDPPPQPVWVDFANIRRFMQLWDIKMIDVNQNTTHLKSLQAFIKSFDPEFQDLSSINDWPGTSRDKIQPVLKQHVQQFVALVSQMSARKSFFVTDKGDFGFATDKASLQDRVCILRGCPLPLLTREHELGDGFEVVGQCYVSGCMYGECLEAMETKGQKWKRFRFR
ncbi:heterokaryon incompatibility protein-domain-containing protein [Cladorrhinum sp. PSN332]|nr:heterokaryon incompatibility protein-domain-containing protein [Cladorrhinum sp. PSN332]